MVNIRNRRTVCAKGADPSAPRRLYSTLTLRRAIDARGLPRGHLTLHPAITLPCALGRSGISHRKREGDKATPAATMRFLHGYYRADRLARPRCRLPLRALTPALGWCDDPASPCYNRPTPLPMRASHEAMWRGDVLYDVVFALDYNMAPRRKGLGSAIFFHCAKPGLVPTLGCVALRPLDMRRLLPRLARRVKVVVA